MLALNSPEPQNDPTLEFVQLEELVQVSAQVLSDSSV